MRKRGDSNPPDIARMFLRGHEIDMALAQGVLEALRRHKQAGIPIAEWRDGRAVLVPPEKIDTRALERAIAAMRRPRRPRRRGRRSADGSVRKR